MNTCLIQSLPKPLFVCTDVYVYVYAYVWYVRMRMNGDVCVRICGMGYGGYAWCELRLCAAQLEAKSPENEESPWERYTLNISFISVFIILLGGRNCLVRKGGGKAKVAVTVVFVPVCCN